jgi:two-component sensor histidine kinase
MAAGRRLAGVKKDGSNISVDIALAPIVSAEGGRSVVLWITDNSARERAETAELFVSELAHRARNMFSIVSAISRQIAKSSSSVSEFQPAFERRLNSLVASYQVFEKANWHSAPLRDLVNSQVEFVMREGHGQIDIQGPDIGLPPNPAEYLGLAIHELSTNALKHGALSVPEGRVDIRWSVDEEDNSFRFSWSERNGPAFSPPSRSGFGSVILKSIVPAAFGGSSELKATEIGMTWQLNAPSSILLAPPHMLGMLGQKEQSK